MFNINLQKIPKFFFAGLLATATHYAVLFGLFNSLNIDLVLATSIGAIAGAMVNYFINYFYTFDSQRRHWLAVQSFLLVVSTGLLINAIVVGLVFHLLGQTAVIAQLTATMVTFAWNFQAHQRWTF